MPARDELKQIYKNKDKLNSTLSQYGTAIVNNYYWSSTECVEDKPEFCAWLVDMYFGNALSFYKNYNYYVRAVSTF
ncbi:MAG: DUF1566 domain-containing protein [Alistipes sp.]|nr:DUF1566 domain-containing protein [Alistipes sp.]